MKNNLLILLLIFPVFAFSQIPNNDFEDWQDVGSETVAGWFNFGNVNKSNDASVGNNALYLYNDSTPGFGQFGAVTNSLEQNLFAGGEKYEETPLSFEFDAKYDLALGDKAQVLVFFTVQGSPLAQLDFSFEGNSGGAYKTFSVPIVWNIFTPPDTVVIILSSNQINTTQSNGPGSVIYDNLRFTSVGQEHGTVDNASFENFAASGVVAPTGWYTSDMYVDDIAGNGGDVNSVIESNQAHHSKSMLLQNVIYETNILPGVAVTGDALNLAFPPTFPMTGKFDYLQGYYQFIPVNGDVGFISTLMYNNGLLIGQGQLDFVTSVDTIGYFSVPITYFGPLVPDSATIVISSADIEDPLGDSTKLWIDKLSYSNNIAHVKSINKTLSLYPNPTRNLLVVDGDKNAISYDVYNSIGDLVFTSKSYILNVSDLPSGTYTIKAANNSIISTSKFIKL